MKAIKVTLGGTVYHLVFNGAAMFDIEDKYESTTNLLDALQGRGRESFMALCDAVCILSEHGELARRALGYNSLPEGYGGVGRESILPAPHRAAG